MKAVTRAIPLGHRRLPGSSGRSPGQGGFTLIELLVVVDIISILASIAVPNFLEAQTRSKVSRVKSDQRALATAVESYRVDHPAYPPREQWPTGSNVGVGDVNTRVQDLSRFTTPISYISSIPEDVFENRIAYPNNLIDFYPPDMVQRVRATRAGRDDNRYGWALMSVGPDGQFGRGSFNLGNYPPERDDFVHFDQEYDPTNGTLSLGNIYRFQNTGGNGSRVFNPNFQD